MSRKNVKSSQPGSAVSWGNGYVIFENTVSQIEGKVLTILEAIGLPQKQEDSLKGLYRRAIWDTISEDGIYISVERHAAIRNEYWNKKKENGNNVPMNAI